MCPLSPTFTSTIGCNVAATRVVPNDTGMVKKAASIVGATKGGVDGVVVRRATKLGVTLKRGPGQVRDRKGGSSVAEVKVVNVLERTFCRTLRYSGPSSLEFTPLMGTLGERVPIEVRTRETSSVVSTVHFTRRFGLSLQVRRYARNRLVTSRLRKLGLGMSIKPALAEESGIRLGGGA